MKILLALTNTVPLLFATYYFFSHLGSENYLQNEILYWIGAILFFIINCIRYVSKGNERNGTKTPRRN